MVEFGMKNLEPRWLWWTKEYGKEEGRKQECRMESGGSWRTKLSRTDLCVLVCWSNGDKDGANTAPNPEAPQPSKYSPSKITRNVSQERYRFHILQERGESLWHREVCCFERAVSESTVKRWEMGKETIR